ncbi:cobyrinate a,c-diamide synthase [Rhizobium sp. P28RR-XV]|uniref:cobyrinate a,c-diamide synthase n=1 Tax=Rhizobium sp. P28RR-XV TaxID=2726737 RepID=UPI0014573712|nr:cobyrinate a,c-diamide synthase [Rhizobium sp. P28RR-XV]NLR83243.1 cobyrinate a,c-diamide synthase [Rhizobium sp. P28RR-XV]
MSGLLIAAPSSGSGKTTFTLGLLRALRNRGIAVASGKAGPDYIDPAFHAAAVGSPCLNFDPWAMRAELISANSALHRAGGRMLVIEGMMGLFDGAADGTGTPADLAALLGLSVLLVVDASRMSQSVAAVVSGFANFRADIRIAGVVLNRVASERHERMLRQALDAVRMPVVAVIRNDSSLALPDRHLGLVQAAEHEALEHFIEAAADVVSKTCDFELLLRAAQRHVVRSSVANIARLMPFGQRIAVARDIAFAFCYEHMLLGWKRRGAEISFFSPLADEAPSTDADAVYLPGGYPELHAEKLAAARQFQDGVKAAAARGARIYGECGGYMMLGEGLVDAAGARHEMLGLLPVVTSYEKRQRHLGYRRVVPLAGSFFDKPMTAHEFHYSTIVTEGEADRLFAVKDPLDADLGAAGLQRANVAGSYMHLIDLAGDAA